MTKPIDNHMVKLKELLKTGSLTELQTERDGMIVFKTYLIDYTKKIRMIRKRIKELKKS